MRIKKHLTGLLRSMVMVIALTTGMHQAYADHYTDMINQRLAEYADAFPEVTFLVLSGSKGMQMVSVLHMLVGPDATNVDYEHSKDARGDLFDLQIGRMALMIKNSLPSATFFENGERSYLERPYTCIVTLDEDRFSGDPRAATELLAGDVDLKSRRIPVGAYLDNTKFVRFTLDHEMFHCLDGYFNGPALLKTSDDDTASYYNFRTEQRADMFATLALRASDREAREFLESLAKYRSLSLLDSDTEHYTTAAIKSALDIPIEAFRDFDLEELVFHTALHFADDLALSRNIYGCILKAIERLNSNSEARIALTVDSPKTEDDRHFARMVDDLRLARTTVFSEF